MGALGFFCSVSGGNGEVGKIAQCVVCGFIAGKSESAKWDKTWSHY